VTLSTHPRVEHRVVGSASIWVLGRVAGPPRTARVLHSDPNALHVDLEGFCLGVLGARAVQLPCGVRTQLPTLTCVEPGTDAVVEDGGVLFGDTEVLVTNIVDTTVPVLAPEVAARCGAQLEEIAGDRLDEARAVLAAEPLSLLAAADPAAVEGLIGVGPGMSPVGDDVLAGWLAAGVSSRHPGLPAVRSAVALSASERTTLLSATLLGCAARGEGVPEFRSLLLGLANENDELVTQSLDLMTHVRRSSGAGLVLGALLALTSLAS
jgi:hypothetical protein